MRRLTLRQFRVFEAVARHMSFSRAAEELHLSQPAVSMQVKGIETILEMPLMERVGKKNFLTDAGHEVLYASRSITGRLNDLEANLAQLRNLEGGRLNVGITTTANPIATDLLARFRLEFPKIELHLDVSNRATVLGRFADNQIDLAIMGQVSDGLGLAATRFMDNPLGIVAAETHPLVKHKRIPVAELAKEPFLLREVDSGTRSVMDRFFEKHKVSLQTSMEMNSNEAIKQAASVGLGLGILSLQTVALELETKRLKVLDVVDFPIMRHWYIVHRNDKRLSPAARAFHDFVLADKQNTGF